jgi:hypothetical protein
MFFKAFFSRRKAWPWIILIASAVLWGTLVTPASAASFSDLQGHWSYQAVTRVATLDLIRGYPSGQFMPDRQVSLLESIVLLLRACGYDQDAKQGKSAAAPAPGSPRVPWGQQYVDLAVAREIIPEDLFKAFDPDAPATRAQVAVMLGRLLQLPPSASSAAGGSFPDLAAVPPGYLTYIAAVHQAGLMQGYNDGSFGPGKSITRGETAALIAHMIDLNWAVLPENRRAEGWIGTSSPASSGKSGSKSRTELVSLQGVRQISLSSPVICFSGGSERPLQDIAGDRVEVLFDSAGRAACVSVLERRPAAQAAETVRGSVKAVILGVESYLVISDLDCDERLLPLAYNAVVDNSSKQDAQTAGFKSLKTGAFIDVFLAGGRVTRVVPLATKQVGGKVLRISESVLYLNEQATGSRPGWFNNWSYARVVDKQGWRYGVLQGDSVQVIYIDAIPGEVDDEIPLEITVTSRPKKN